VRATFPVADDLSPKAACRLARFRAVLERRRRAPGRSWGELAIDAGFADQAHLTNELKAFTGLTPTELASRGGGASEAAAGAQG
jgi:methylphosphotriester-DNA--protein-cysteine methyltransferase